MTINQIKIYAVAIIVIPVLAAAVLLGHNAAAATRAADDAAAVYKAKCAMCHTPKATKFFDPAKTDEEHIQVILKGKKVEKPPHMPSFEDKGISADMAKELAAYMKQLRTAGN